MRRHGDDGQAVPAFIGQRADLAGHFRPRAARQAHVQQYRVDLDIRALQQRQRGLAIGRGQRGVAERLEVAQAHQAVDVVVFDHQHRQRLARLSCLRGARRRLRDRGHDAERQLEPHLGAFARRAGEADAALHQLDQATADGEAQPGAAVAPVRGVLDLHERLEHGLLLRLRDADAGVADGEAQAHRPVFPVFPVAHATHRDAHFPFVGELDRVADGVEEDLVELAAVAFNVVRNIGGDVAHQRDALAARGHRLQHQHVVDGGIEHEGFGLEVELAGLEAREAEDILQDLQQRGAGVGDHVQVFLLATVERGVLQQLHDAPHAAQGGAQLVAQGGEEFVLGAAGFLRPLSREGVLRRLVLEQGVALLQFAGACRDLLLQLLLVAQQGLLQALPRARIVGELLERLDERGQRVAAAGVADLDVELAAVERAHRGFEILQAVEHVEAEDHPQGAHQRAEQQRRHGEEAGRAAVHRPVGELAGLPDGEVVGGDEGVAGVAELARELVAFVAQGQALLAQPELAHVKVEQPASRKAVGQQAVMGQAFLAAARVDDVLQAAAQHIEVGSEVGPQRLRFVDAVLQPQPLELRLEGEAHRLQFGHPFGAIDVDLDQAVEQFEHPLPCGSLLEQRIEAGNGRRGGGGRVRRERVGQPHQRGHREFLAGEGRSFLLADLQPLACVVRLSLEVALDAVHRRFQRRLQPRVDAAGVQARQQGAQLRQLLLARAQQAVQLFA